MKYINIHSMWIKCFFFIFFLMALPIIIITSQSRQYTINTMLEQKRQSDLKDLASLASTLSVYLDSIENLSNQLVFDMHKQNLSYYLSRKIPDDDTENYNNLSVILDSYKANFPSICHISLMSKTGRFINESTIDRDRLSWFFNPTFLKQLESKGALWTPSFSIEYLENSRVERVMAFATPVYDSSHLISGYLLVYIPIDNIRALLMPFEEDTIILENSHILASKKKIPYYKDVFQLYNINYGYLLTETNVIVSTEDKPLVVTTKNYSRTSFQLQLAIISSYTSLEKAVSANVPNILFVSAYGIIFSLLSAILLARHIAKPIFSLKKVMNKTKSGDFDTRVSIKGRDEVAELGITFNSLLDTIKNLLVTLEQKHEKQQRIQLQLIQEQVKPHFLYNMLETINSMIRCDLKEDSIQVTSNLANFYRISLNNGANIIKVSQEIELVENYLMLQRLRYIEFMDYTLAFSPNIYDYTIPKLSLQPLIENSIYHGLKEKGTSGILCISGYIENNFIIFEIFDTGQGISEDKIQEIQDSITKNEDIDNYFGIASVLKRLNIFCDNRALLQIDSVLGEYTCITISYPIEKSSERKLIC